MQRPWAEGTQGSKNSPEENVAEAAWFLGRRVGWPLSGVVADIARGLHFFFYCKEPDSKYFWLHWAIQSVLQLLNSTIVAPKQPQETCKWMGMAVFK